MSASEEEEPSRSSAAVPPWEQLVRHIATTPSLSGQPCDAGHGDLSAALTQLRKLCWPAYHAAFTGDAAQHPIRASPVSPCTADPSHDEGLVPQDAAELPLFVQALGHIALALQTSGTTLRADSNAAASLEAVGQLEWLLEVQALLCYIGRHRLRYLTPPSLASVRAASLADTLLPADAERQRRDDRPAPGTNMAAAPARRDSAVVAADALPLRRLQRRAEEEVQHLVAPLAPEELLRVVVLVEAARTVLDEGQPLPAASGVRAEVYAVLLSVLGASEQLSSSTLASLATCLARCVDSYATCQQLAVQVAAEGDAAATGPAPGWSSFLRGVVVRDAAGPRVAPSPVELHEAARLGELRGGLAQQLRPTAVLHHMRALANVLQHRLALALHTAEQSANAHEDAREEVPADSVHAAASTSSPAAAPRPAVRKEAMSSAAARVAQEVQLQSGLLGVLTLEQRKARTGATANTAPAHRRRRTVAEIAAAAAAPPAAAVAPSPHTQTDISAPDVSTGTVALTDVAEVCSAMAAVGFRGDAGASDELFWVHAVEFTCAEVAAVAQARQDTSATPGDGVADSGLVAAAQGAVVDQLLRDARDVCFALDHVAFRRGYDRVMAALVHGGFLREVIAAPTAGRRAMRDIPS